MRCRVAGSQVAQSQVAERRVAGRGPSRIRCWVSLYRRADQARPREATGPTARRSRRPSHRKSRRIRPVHVRHPTTRDCSAQPSALAAMHSASDAQCNAATAQADPDSRRARIASAKARRRPAVRCADGSIRGERARSSGPVRRFGFGRAFDRFAPPTQAGRLSAGPHPSRLPAQASRPHPSASSRDASKQLTHCAPSRCDEGRVAGRPAAAARR